MRGLAHVTARFPRVVLSLTAVFVIAAAAVGATVIPHLTSSGYSDPNSQSAWVANQLTDVYKTKYPHLSIVIGIRDQSDAATTAEVKSVADAVVADIAAYDGVTNVVSYWNTGAPSMLSTNRGLGLALVYLKDGELDSKNAIAKEIIAATPATQNGVEIYVGGGGAIYTGINGQITDDLKFAETLSIPLTLLLLLLVFGTAMAAAQPLIVGLSAIGASLFGIWVVNHFTDISVFSLNLLTGLGLGLGIDYALLMVNRFREELARGRSTEEAVRVTVQTAGRTVMFSGFTVAVTMASLLLFPQAFLKSFAYGGVLVCGFAVAGALVPLPAILRLLGPRIDKFRVWRGRLAPEDTGIWSAIARGVMARPWLTIVPSVLLLTGLALLARDAVLGQVDYRVLPPSHPAAMASAVLEEDFGGNSKTPIELLVTKSETDSAVGNLGKRLSMVGGVLRVDTAAGVFASGHFTAMPPGWNGLKMAAGESVRLQVFSDVEPRSADAQALVHRLRDVSPDIKVGGMAGDYTDTQDGVARMFPWALLWVTVSTLLLLFLFTGSFVLPLKAVLLNILSLSATLGVLTYLFQFGHMQWLTGQYTVTHSLDTSTLVMALVLTFGLSMDYEVFLLSRIKEEHDRGEDTTESVALGLQRSGRIITAAALVLAAVFVVFVTSNVTSIKMIGIGIPFAILLDATLVRALLVPALMRVMGEYNWWAPKWAKRLHYRVGVQD